MATAPASAFERPKTISLPWHNPGKATRDGTYRLQTARPSRLPVALNRPDGFDGAGPDYSKPVTTSKAFVNSLASAFIA